ncbi:MAG: HEAT repeat domain-containing protein [Spirulina sp. SIO3F2]|nr:HEAT repeat domain-containing protein [Spirulina sp. SIO3F2]
MRIDWTVETAIANLQPTVEGSLRYYAAWWLGHFRISRPEAIDGLLVALNDETHRSPDGGLALCRNAARALGKLQDPRIVSALRQRLTCEDYYVREVVIQALESQADPSCIPDLIAFLEGGAEAAISIPGKPHLVQPYEAVLEALGTLQAKSVAPLIQEFLLHPVPKVQLAAARALYQLTQEPQYGERLVLGLRHEKLVVRRSALMDLGASGYIAGASAIAATLAENSLKLTALKDLFNAHLHQSGTKNDPENLDATSEQLISLMDALL